jgi:hypothetical protein
MVEVDKNLIASLRTDCLTWTALHHFLPANHFRELMNAIVDAASSGRFSLGQLFEEEVVDSAHNLDSWIIRPLPLKDPTAEYLQRRIRYLVWQHDEEAYTELQALGDEGSVNAKSIENALRLGRLDLANASVGLKDVRFPEGTAIRALSNTILLLSESAAGRAESLAEARRWLDKIDMPLRAVAMKHVGDLCADSDLWDLAYHLYDHTIELLGDLELSEQTAFTQILETLVIQSKASALRISEGSSEAAAYLLGQLQNEKFQRAPLLALNASHDAMVAELSQEPLVFRPDQRATMLFPPQLLKSHDGSTALDSWADGNYTAASQHFWALLRRQIALGASSDTRVTKANYARNLYAELDSQKDRHRMVDQFLMATRLLIESGQSESAKKFSWSPALIEAYVNVPLIEAAIEHGSRHKGTLLERNNVLTEIFGAWAERLGPSSSEVVVALFKYLTGVARDGRTSFYASHNGAGRSLELLCAIVQRRPEFRSLTSADVLQVILQKIAAPGFWNERADALKLASEYLTAFSAEQADQAVAAVLKLLGELDPTKDIWPIVQPAMNILMSGAMPGLSERNPDLGRDVVSTILRFGIGQQSEHGRLLFFLEDFDLRSISDPKLTLDLEQVLQDVLARAREINSSAAVYNICGLLYGSKVSGAHGVRAALESFRAILTSPDRDIPSIALPAAYQVLTILSSRQMQIVSETKFDEVAFAREMEEILDLVIALWHRAAKKPMVFASFSLPPPTRPSSTVIHNWAYASVGFGLAIGKGSQILEVLAAAEMQPELRDAVGSGRSARLGAAEIETVTKERISNESRDTFYAALGNRLLQLRTLSGGSKAEILGALVDKCFEVGPNGLDSGIFLLAEGIDSTKITENPEFDNYRTRLNQSQNRDLRLSLFPMLLNLTENE